MKRIKRSHLITFGIGFAGGLFALAIMYGVMVLGFSRPSTFAEKQGVGASFAAYIPDGAPESFAPTAKLVTPSVVHIRNLADGGSRRRSDSNFFFPFPPDFDDDFQIPFGSSHGSGVIISEDGYIVTNHHVIKNADKLEVTLFDKRKYTATVIGSDENTDIALLKIKETNLPFLRFGDSDKIEVGEWVLAVGNPMNLTSTVTAGIISAKARNINLLSSAHSVEAFIQTDAAVNPGNSGGALVAVNGELIGINTAIASRTGSYAGYSFAVPSKLVNKVVDDLMNHGEVQRGFLGVSIQDVTADLAEKNNLSTPKGVYINEVNLNSAAEEAGLKKGDIVLKVNDKRVNSSAELQEQISRMRPGDKVTLTISRNGNEKLVDVVLKNKSGNTGPTSKSSSLNQQLGAELEPITKTQKEELRIENGVTIKKLNPGILRANGLREGFVITHIDKQPIAKVEDVTKALKGKSGAVLIEGVKPTGQRDAYAIIF